MKSGALDGDGFLLVSNVEFGQVVFNHQADEFLELSDINHGVWSGDAAWGGTIAETTNGWDSRRIATDHGVKRCKSPPITELHSEAACARGRSPAQRGRSTRGRPRTSFMTIA